MGGKLWRKLGAWKTYMLREKEERREHKLRRENGKFHMLTNEDQASLNSQKDETKHCLLFD